MTKGRFPTIVSCIAQVCGLSLGSTCRQMFFSVLVHLFFMYFPYATTCLYTSRMPAHTAGLIFSELSLCLDKMCSSSLLFLVEGEATLQ